MAVSKRGWTWSNKAWCYSREVGVGGCCRARLIVTEEDLERFCLSQISWTAVEVREGSLLSMDTT